MSISSAYKDPLVTVHEYRLMEELVRGQAEEDVSPSSAETQALSQYCKQALESGPLTWDKVATIGLWIYQHQVELGVEQRSQEDLQMLAMLTNPPEELVTTWNSLQEESKPESSLRQRILQQISCCFPWLRNP